MASYRIDKPAFIGGALLPAGSIIDFAGTPSRFWAPLDGPATTAIDKLTADLGRTRPNGAKLMPWSKVISNAQALRGYRGHWR